MSAENSAVVRQIVPQVVQLETYKAGCITSADALKMNQWTGPDIRVESNKGPTLPFKQLSDGSSLISADVAGLGLLRTLPPGSIVTYMETSRPVGQAQLDTLDEETPQGQARLAQIAKTETVAIVVDQTTGYTKLLGLRRSPREDESTEGQSYGSWGTYDDERGQPVSEKLVAVNILQRLFHPTKGNQATQMLSRGLIPYAQRDSNVTISEVGCSTHETPIDAVLLNFLQGDMEFVPPLMLTSSANMMVRVAYNPTLHNIGPLAQAGDEPQLDDAHLLALAYGTRARKIAKTNPLNLGGGTTEGFVLEAMVNTTIKVAESNAVQNGATAGHVQQDFRSAMGIR